MAENANESWRKPTNIQLLCLVLSTSSVQKAVPMNSEKFPSWRPNKKLNKCSSSSCSKHFAHGLTPGWPYACNSVKPTCIKWTHKALDLERTLASATSSSLWTGIRSEAYVNESEQGLELTETVYSEVSIIFYYTIPSQPTFLVRFQFILCPILFHVGTISHRADIVFLIQICNEWNKRIFCYKNQWVSCWRININRWRQREYRYSNISDKTVNWILAEGRVRERYIRKGNKNRNKIERWIIFAGYFGLQHKPSTGTKTKRVQI